MNGQSAKQPDAPPTFSRFNHLTQIYYFYDEENTIRFQSFKFYLEKDMLILTSCQEDFTIFYDKFE